MTALIFAVLAALAPAAFQEAVTPVQYNADQLVRQAAQGIIVPPGFGSDPVRIDPDGHTHAVPGTGRMCDNYCCRSSF